MHRRRPRTSNCACTACRSSARRTAASWRCSPSARSRKPDRRTTASRPDGYSISPAPGSATSRTQPGELHAGNATTTRHAWRSCGQTWWWSCTRACSSSCRHPAAALGQEAARISGRAPCPPCYQSGTMTSTRPGGRRGQPTRWRLAARPPRRRHTAPPRLMRNATPCGNCRSQRRLRRGTTLPPTRSLSPWLPGLWTSVGQRGRATVPRSQRPARDSTGLRGGSAPTG